jgi:hypothetical protein
MRRLLNSASAQGGDDFGEAGAAARLARAGPTEPPDAIAALMQMTRVSGVRLTKRLLSLTALSRAHRQAVIL